jgi:hypothetical protein
MKLYRNIANQFVQLGSLVKTSDGSRLTSSATARWCKDGTWGAGAGTLSVEETDQYKYAPTQAETNCEVWALAVDHADAVHPLVVQGRTEDNCIWYVAASGGSDSNPGTRALPLSTLSEAHTRAQSGDTIHVLTGTLTTGLTVTKDNLTIEGDGTDSLIQVSSGCPLNITADYCTVRRLTLVSTEVSSAGIGIDVDTTVGTTIEQVSATGPFDGIQGVNSVRLTLRRCAFNSNFDGGTLTGASRLHASDCIFSTDATYAGASAHHGMIIDGDAVFERSTFQSMRTVAGSIRQSAFERSANATAQPRFVDCTFITSATHASNTGVVNGISEQYTAGVPSQDLKATILGGSINVVNSGSGATRIISATRAASLVRLLNVQFDKTTLHESAAGANVKWLDDPLNDWLDGGRLDLILDARASQASVDDLPTNSELSTALAAADDAVLVAIDALPTNSELATALAAADDAVLTAVGTITAKLPSKTYLTGTNNSDGDIQLDEATGTVNATIEQAAIDAIVDDMWDEDETGHTTANTFGKELQDLESRLTTTRAGYLDNLNVGGAVASASSLSTVASAVTTISNKLGSWTGTGIETVLGAFRAMFRKDASVSVPTDINSGGGSANNTTDSQEALADTTPSNTVAALKAAILSVTPTNGTIEEALVAARAQGIGRWSLDSGSRILTLYAHDGTTVLKTLLVNPDLTNPLTRTPQ